jgi:hypothetical protein
VHIRSTLSLLVALSLMPVLLYARGVDGTLLDLARVNDDIGWLGHTHIYRFDMPDPVYCDESLRFSIEHEHNNDLTLDIDSVACCYQTGQTKPFPLLPDREARALKPFIGPMEFHRWRHEWRENLRNSSRLWGNERVP